MNDKKAYVVFVGRRPGIYFSWMETEQQVIRFSGAVYKRYQSRALAEEALASWEENIRESSSCEAMKPLYTVLVGRNCGIFENKSEAESQILDYPDGFYEIYSNYEEAQAAVEKFFLGESVIRIAGANKP